MKPQPLLSLLLLLGLLLCLCAATPSVALKWLTASPYRGAIVVDGATGRVLFEDNADVESYPASVTKLMVLLIIMEGIEAGYVTPEEPVITTAAAARIGGSQVYLKENEVFPVDDLLYALMVESANDAAAALAIHYAGSKEAFVEIMNRRAALLGMSNTSFHSVNGLPPSRGQLPDISTPRDFAKLCCELLKHPDALEYTSTIKRSFRTEAAEPFIMINHNNLLKKMKGCDGLKTGYFPAAGFAIAATAARNGKRAVAVVFGAARPKERDIKTQEILSDGLRRLFMETPEPQEPAPPLEAAETEPSAANPEAADPEVIQIKRSTLRAAAASAACLLAAGIVLFLLVRRRRR